MIFIGLGANLPSTAFGPPAATCEAALGRLAECGAAPRRRSRWYRSRPEPDHGEPWFVNGVAEVETALAPLELLAVLHRIEAEIGRVRGAPNAPRCIDLDLLDYGGRLSGPADTLILPHPRMHLRAFVLYPLAELAPDWRHPRSGASIGALVGALSPDQDCKPCRAAPAPT